MMFALKNCCDKLFDVINIESNLYFLFEITKVSIRTKFIWLSSNLMVFQVQSPENVWLLLGMEFSFLVKYTGITCVEIKHPTIYESFNTLYIILCEPQKGNRYYS